MPTTTTYVPTSALATTRPVSAESSDSPAPHIPGWEWRWSGAFNQHKGLQACIICFNVLRSQGGINAMKGFCAAPIGGSASKWNGARVGMRSRNRQKRGREGREAKDDLLGLGGREGGREGGRRGR